MRFYKLFFFLVFLLFSQNSFSSDYYFIDQTNGALTACRADINATNQYYCSLTVYNSYQTISTPQAAYTLGFFSLRDSSGTVVNNYIFGTNYSNATPNDDCPDIADLGFYTQYVVPKCSGTPPEHICPASTHWQFSNNQCVYSGADADGDGVPDDGDNCPAVSNLNQTDTDGDGVGDACDTLTDTDGDGVGDSSDNCPFVVNAGQADSDSDGIGDACDDLPDMDGDGVPDSTDNCPSNANSDQLDSDSDGAGDVCDQTPFPPDADGDGVPDLSDNCPNTPNADQANADGDAFGDVCDASPYPDYDGDGVPNSSDNCPGEVNPGQDDMDGDAVGDACDPCQPGDYTEHQSFASDSVSGSIPTEYCNSQLCKMTKTAQSCASGSCSVDYQSTGASCSANSTPSNWGQYFIGSPAANGYDFQADLNAFGLTNSMSNITGGNTSYFYKVTGCRQSISITMNQDNTYQSVYAAQSLACAGFVESSCMPSADLDAYVTDFVKTHHIINGQPVDFLTTGGSQYSHYFYVVNGHLKPGSWINDNQGSMDYNLGTDSGTGIYQLSLVGNATAKQYQYDTGSVSYTNNMSNVGTHIFTLQGCGDPMGGTGGTGSVGDTSNLLTKLSGTGPSLYEPEGFTASGNRLMDAITTTGPLAGVEQFKTLVIGGEGNVGECPALTLDTGDEWWGEVSTTVHCDLLEQNREMIGYFASTFWLLTGLWIFLGA